MANMFLSGHGGWKPAFGYVQVPRGVSVAFYTHFAKNLITGMEYKILDGSYTTVDRVIGEYSQCPNMQISGQEAAWTTKSESKLNKAYWGDKSMVIGVPEGQNGKLQEFFDLLSKTMNRGDTCTIHWLACSTLQLSQVGGRNHGLNAGDFKHDPNSQGRYRIRNPDGSFLWI
nr:hypothetical protein [Gemmatimonas aurantiaca]